MNTVIKRAWNKNKLVKVEDLTGMTFQAESGGHTFEISGVDDTGAAVSLSGTVEGRFLRADNAEIIISGTASGGKASVTLPAACYAIPGRFLLTIYVTSGGQKVAVYAATGSVVATSGTAGGSIPPLVTDSVQANTGTFGSINTGNATVEGVLDVTKRRCYAYLSRDGWYRILQFNASTTNAQWSDGVKIDITITTSYRNTSNSLHEISMLGIFRMVDFVNETSYTNVRTIDKIRYVYGADGNGYIDLHYNLNDGNDVAVDFNVHYYTPSQKNIMSVPMTAVDDSPTNETVMKEYSFADNTYNGMRYYREVISSLTIGADGFTTMTTPSQIVGRKIVNIMFVTFGTTSGGAMLIMSYSNASGNARNSYYIIGSPGASMTNVIIEYWYL